MKETSKALHLQTRRDLYARYLHGTCIDVGAGTDPLVWEGVTVCPFDRNMGDAQRLMNFCEERYDCLFSSHCLEHMVNVPEALWQWSGVVKRGGHLIIVVPDATWYERLVWPSPFNDDHKAQFSAVSIPPEKIKCPSFYGFSELSKMGHDAGMQIVEFELELEGYDWHLANYLIDVTAGTACCNLVVVFKKI